MKHRISISKENSKTVKPITSPYGDVDRWDMLWLGHCGGRFPRADDRHVPLGRVPMYNDETVPPPKHLAVEEGDWAGIQSYPAYTRVVSRAWQNTCSLAFAITQGGAQRILYELSLKKMSGTTDMMYRSLCHGSEGRPVDTCLTVTPELFASHRPIGDTASFSDINDNAGGYNDHAHTRNIRWSTRMNMRKLIDGATSYIDQFGESD